jgi:signal transduction histidine kinase
VRDGNLLRLLPRSLRWRFRLFLSALVVLVVAGSAVAVYALRVAADTTRQLAGERLAQLQDAQDVVQRTLLIERQAGLAVAATSLEDTRRSHARLIEQLDELDRLVDRLGTASDDVEILSLQASAQLFRNTTHVVARLREGVVQDPPAGTDASAAGTTPAERERLLHHFQGELSRQTEAMVASAGRVSARVTAEYRDTVTAMAERSRTDERWVVLLLGASLLLAWLVSRYLLGRQVLHRLQQVSHHLRLGDGAGEAVRVPVQGDDEIGEMARSVEHFLADRRRLNEANRELEDLSYSVSHDLRAPLRHIDGYAALLRGRVGEGLDPQGRHYLDEIAAAGQRMGALVEGLLSFVGMRRSEMAPGLVEVLPLVREVVAGLAPELAGRDVEWKLADVPAVVADRAMLRLVVEALLSNAVKFTRACPRAQIEIGASTPPGGAEVVLFVRDNGIGFDMKHADKLFRVFHRLHRAEDFGGTGIGLANVRRIVERHGGRAWAEGAPGRGATFHVSFPGAT